MSTTKRKVMGEGGSHAHRLTAGTTENDGIHKHLFFVNDRLLMTDLSGAHSHSINAAVNEIGAGSPHEHEISVKTSDGLMTFKTANYTPHNHELQSEHTTLSGVHTHEVVINDNSFISMIPADLIEAVEAATQKVASLKEFKVRKSVDDPFEADFQGVQRLNKGDFKDILKEATTRATLKGLSRLNEGFQIESLVLSRDRFTDIGVARRFVMDHGLTVRSSEERDGVFVFEVHSTGRFVETSLHRVQITDGVTAVVGLLREGEPGQQLNPPEMTEGSGADGLTENAITPPEKPGASGTVDEMTDTLHTEQKKPLAEMFADVKKAYGIDTEKPVKKRETAKTDDCMFTVMKVDKKKRLVTGPVLIPENFDLQNDVISHEEIETAIHNYMIKLTFQDRDPEFLEQLGLNDVAEAGFMHVEFSRKIVFVEVWIAPVDITFTDTLSGEPYVVKAGTCIATAKVFDDETWNLVEAGKITGFSIGGRSKVLPA